MHDSHLFDLVTLLQTFRQTVERPNIIRVLCTPLSSTAQSQILATDLLGLAVMALLSQQSCKRMRGEAFWTMRRCLVRNVSTVIVATKKSHGQSLNVRLTADEESRLA